MLSLDLVEKGLVTDQLVLTVGYDIENLRDPKIASKYKGKITTDHYGRKVPKAAHGTINLKAHTSSTKLITDEAKELYDRIVDGNLLVRRINISANHIVEESSLNRESECEQLSFFSEHEVAGEAHRELEKEKDIQKAILNIKKKYGKNALLKGASLEEGATAKGRNEQIGGHKA